MMNDGIERDHLGLEWREEASWRGIDRNLSRTSEDAKGQGRDALGMLGGPPAPDNLGAC